MNNKPDSDWELSNPYWIAELSNGDVFYGDNNDPSPDERSKWTDLKYELRNSLLRINKVILKFRSNEVYIDIPKDSNWVYFSKAMGKEWTEENTDKFFVVGKQETPTMIKKFWYKLPELTLHKETANEIQTCKEEFLLFQPVI